MLPSHGYDFVQWTPATRGLYESNYVKANSLDGKRGIWLKHNILAPRSAGAPALLEVWCILFDKDKGAPKAVKQMLPMSSIKVSKTALRIEGDGVLLTDRETRTSIEDHDGTKASWDIQFESLAPPIFHLPHPKMYTSRFPKKKMTTPAPKLRLSGKLTFGKRSIDVTDWIGLRGHNWGSEHAFSYAYGNCNLFNEDDEAILDMFSAKILLGPVRSPWLSAGVLREGGRRHNFKSLRTAVTRQADINFPGWAVTLKSGKKRLDTKWSLDPEQCIGLRYLHPDGKVSYCYNTKFAHLTANVDGRELTSDRAELEFLFAHPIPGLPLHGDESF
jgi:hypothetical protein